MHYQETLVTKEDLKDSVLCYWEMTGSIEKEGGLEMRYIPKGQNLLIFNFGGTITLLDIPDQTYLNSSVFILPAVASSKLFNQKGKIDLFGVSFIADGLYQLINQPVSKQGFDLPEPLAKNSKQLYKQLSTMSFSEKTIMAEEFLNTSMNQGNHNPSFLKAFNMIKETKGCARVSELAEIAHVTERQLQRLFSTRLGVSPKDYCKIVRVNSYINFVLESEQVVDWMELVVAFNYHDQPHLIKEVKDIAKLSPKKLLSYRDTLYDHYS